MRRNKCEDQYEMDELLERLERFRDDRNWSKYHTSEALAREIMIEAGELNGLFEWGATPTPGRHREDLADVLICTLNACIAAGFDPIEICHEKINKNAVKYPA